MSQVCRNAYYRVSCLKLAPSTDFLSQACLNASLLTFFCLKLATLQTCPLSSDLSQACLNNSLHQLIVLPHTYLLQPVSCLKPASMPPFNKCIVSRLPHCLLSTGVLSQGGFNVYTQHVYCLKPASVTPFIMYVVTSMAKILFPSSINCLFLSLSHCLCDPIFRLTHYP